MKSFTDIFIKHPVLAVGRQPRHRAGGVAGADDAAGAAVSPDRELVGRHHDGLLRRQRRDRARLPHDADRARRSRRSAAWTTSSPPAAPGVSTVTVHLKLNHNSTAALAEVTARLQQVRSELPAEAEPPVVEVQRADRPYASFYLSFTSTERDVPAITDWLAAHAAAAARHAAGRAAGDHRGRPPARDAGLDRSRPAGRAQPRAGRRAGGAAAQQLPRRGRPDQGQPGPGQPARQHRPALGGGVREPDRRRPRRRHRAPERRGAGRAGRRRGRHGREVQRQGGASTSACGRWSASTRSTSRTGCAPRWSASGRRCPRTSTCGWRTTRTRVHGGRAQGDHQDAGRDDPDRRRSWCSSSWARCARRWCRWSRCRSRWSARRS